MRVGARVGLVNVCTRNHQASRCCKLGVLVNGTNCESEKCVKVSFKKILTRAGCNFDYPRF